MNKRRWLIVLCVLAGNARAMEREFPSDAIPITRDTFIEKVVGKSFSGVIDNAADWTMEFSADGTFTWHYSSVTVDIGKWRIEGNKFCGDMQRSSSTCNEFRIRGDDIFYKRVSNGEVVRLSSHPVPEAPGEIGPYVGTWRISGTNVKDAELVIKDGGGGSWRTYASQNARVANWCWSDALPVAVQRVLESRVILLVEGSKLVQGCEDIALSIKRVDDQTLKGSFGGGAFTAQRH